LQAKLLRYGTEDQREVIHTPLDPIEDLCNLILGLRSEEYVRYVLLERHEISEAVHAEGLAQQIGLHAENAVGFIHQAYAGPPELSFLPLYYAVLSLSKLYVLCSHNRGELSLPANAYHGATIDRSKVGFSDREITLCTQGVLPLLYRSITGETISGVPRVRAGDLLGYIPCLEDDLRRGLGLASSVCYVDLDVLERGDRGYELRVTVHAYDKRGCLAGPEELELLKGLQLAKGQASHLGDVFSVALPGATDLRQAVQQASELVPRHLLYTKSPHFFGGVMTAGIARSALRLPEEIPLWLLFFCLSNVVRYSPEMLVQVRATREWPLLLALRKHGLLRFLVLFWSFFHRTTYCIRPGTV
jgi:hypothetical protein